MIKSYILIFVSVSIILLLSCGKPKEYTCSYSLNGGTFTSTFNESIKKDCSYGNIGSSNCTTNDLGDKSLKEWLKYYRDKEYTCERSKSL